MTDQFNILDYTSGPLLKTGQTTDFTPAGRTTKDDGGFQRGIAGSKADGQYNILTTGQYSGTTNITVDSIVDAHTNNCVQDKVTGLMWSREASANIFGTGTQGLLWDDTAGTNQDIFEYCDQANLSALAGFSDWRIPNASEISSLSILNTSTNGKPNTTAFPVWSNRQWTSTTAFFDTSQAYVFNFSLGHYFEINKTFRRAVSLVRLGIE